MDLLYTITEADGEYTIRAKREANIKLASIKDVAEFNKQRTVMNKVVDIAITLDNAVIWFDSDANEILQGVTRILNKKPLSPLTLEDDEFKLDDTGKYYHIYENIRYDNIIKRINLNNAEVSVEYYNTFAFRTIPKAYYNHAEKKEIVWNHKHFTLYNPKIYITKGGVVTGEYIRYCNIDKSRINEVDFTEVILLPISVIHTERDSIFTVDSREPAIKVLKSMYDVVMDFTPEYKGVYDIRKYTKLNK